MGKLARKRAESDELLYQDLLILVNLLNRMLRDIPKFIDKYKIWVTARNGTISEIQSLNISQLHDKKRSTDNKTMGAAGASITSGAATLSGIIGVPFTGGLSIFLTAAGVTGGVGAGAFQLYNLRSFANLENDVAKKVTSLLNKDKDLSVDIGRAAEKLQKLSKQIEKIVQRVQEKHRRLMSLKFDSHNWIELSMAPAGFRSLRLCGLLTIDDVARFGAKIPGLSGLTKESGKALVKNVSIALTVISMGLDVVDFGAAAYSRYHESKSKTGLQCETALQYLEGDKTSLENLYNLVRS